MVNTKLADRKDTIAKRRDKIIVKTGFIGIAANVLLAVFKAGVGIFSHSIAITLDAVNNFSDAASSIITIVGTKLSGKAPDQKHPFGHGRGEYLTAMLISVIVLCAGITSLKESVKKIIIPVAPDYSTFSLTVVFTAIAVKIVLAKYFKNVGTRVNSDSLVNSGKEAELDSVIGTSTLVSAIIFIFTGFSSEAFLGIMISIIIIRSGTEMLRDTTSKILGEDADSELARGIKSTVVSFPTVISVHDLVMNNYGPDRFNGSIQIEVPSTYTANQIDELSHDISNVVLLKHNVKLTAIGIYSLKLKNDKGSEISENNSDFHDWQKASGQIYTEIKSLYPECNIQITLDKDDPWEDKTKHPLSCAIT